MTNEREHQNKEGVLTVTIDGKKYEWNEQYITGEQIKKLAGLSEDSELFLKIKKPWEDESVTNETRINLARPGIEHFYVKLKVILIVNGREKPWEHNEITFHQIVQLAFPTHVENPNTVFTVVYKNGPEQNPQGTMTKGDRVYAKNKMIFNVTATDKS